MLLKEVSTDTMVVVSEVKFSDIGCYKGLRLQELPLRVLYLCFFRIGLLQLSWLFQCGIIKRIIAETLDYLTFQISRCISNGLYRILKHLLFIYQMFC
jgi:hypothetical protein